MLFRSLSVTSYEDTYYVTFKVAGTLVDGQNRIVTSIKGSDGSTTKVLQANLDEAQARELRSGPLLYLDRFPVVAGRYDFDLVLENNVSREYGRESFTIDVPAPWPSVVRSSRPLLLWAVFDDPGYDPFAEHYPFQIGRHALIPAIDPVFNPAGAIMVFQQLYLPRGHQGFLEPTYRLSNGSETSIDRIEYIDPADADSNGTINHLATLLLADAPAAVDAQRAGDDNLDHESPLAELFEDQLLCADMVILNKTDLMDDEAVRRVRAHVIEIGRAACRERV